MERINKLPFALKRTERVSLRLRGTEAAVHWRSTKQLFLKFSKVHRKASVSESF